MNTRFLKHKMILALCCALGPVPARADGEPVKLTGAARFDLSADAPAGALENGLVVAGNGTISRMSWAPESDQPRGYTVSFPVTFLGWRSLAVRFTPARAGTITLTLMGPWEEASKGVIYRQEVLWDDIRAEGAALTHGGFESPGDERATGWQGGGGVVVQQTSEVPAAEGSHYARTWHDQTLFTTLKVTGGRPVTLRVRARAVRPASLIEMKRIVGRSTPAHRAARRFLRGANLGNGLEVPPGQDWGVHYTPEDLRQIRAQGFDHDPFYFTHQGADWAGPDTKVTGILFPGPPARPLVPDPRLKLNSWVLNWLKAYNTEPAIRNPSSPGAFQGAIDQAEEWSSYYGRPVHFGEFGCLGTADPGSRAHYYRAFRESAEKAKIGWAIWDWKANFHYWNAKTGRPEPGMHEALFDPSTSPKIE
ncbi:MAG: hypothetical protein ACHRXM_01120 [Isosphaerales bacterium]